MTQCEQLSERMPDVAAGRAGWSAQESRHLEGCAECREELALVRAAMALGRDVEQEVDGDRISAALLTRLRAPDAPAVTPRRWAPVALIAAAAVLALFVWPTAVVNTTVSEGAGEALVIRLPALDSLDAGQLEQVYDGLDAPISSITPGPDPRLDDLSTGELERVLRSLEG